MTENNEKTYNPNLWGLVAALVSISIFAVSYLMFDFPDMLIHVFMLPVIIGFVVRWQIRLNHTKHYRGD